MEKKTYQVTELAGTHVAGRRIQDRNDPLLLTEEEARLELVAGTIRPSGLLPPASEGVKVAPATGVELVGIEAAAGEGEAPLGAPDAPAAKPASKRR